MILKSGDKLIKIIKQFCTIVFTLGALTMPCRLQSDQLLSTGDQMEELISGQEKPSVLSKTYDEGSATQLIRKVGHNVRFLPHSCDWSDVIWFVNQTFFI